MKIWSFGWMPLNGVSIMQIDIANVVVNNMKRTLLWNQMRYIDGLKTYKWNALLKLCGIRDFHLWTSYAR
jgi:hypothetical protein